MAQRSAQAAQDTARLIEDSISKSNNGKQELAQVASSVHSITEAASNVKTLVDELNLGSQEQARGFDHMAKALAQIEQATQDNAASAEESASAGEELSAQSEALNGIVENLSALVGAQLTQVNYRLASTLK